HPGRPASARAEPVAAAGESRGPRPPALRYRRRRVDHERRDAARLRADPRDAARLGNRVDDRADLAVGRADPRVRRDRVALARAVAAAADVPPADARGLERDAAARGRVLVLAVLPADALHAAGAALLGAQDGHRLHRADA